MYSTKRGRKAFILCAFLLILLLAIYHFGTLPRTVRVAPREPYQLQLGIPFLRIEDRAAGLRYRPRGYSYELFGREPGVFSLQLSLFGLISLPEISVEVVPRPKVVPSGQAIGIMLAPKGLLVGDTVRLHTVSGEWRSPASEAGLMSGDVLLEVAGEPVTSPLQLRWLLGKHCSENREVQIRYERQGLTYSTKVRTARVRDRNGQIRHMLGIWVEDPAAGVGTLTFFDQRTRKYGGLGHAVTDSRGRQITVANGRIAPAWIADISQGHSGRPGEKVGSFSTGSGFLGTIEKNSQFGIYGRLFTDPLVQGKEVPVAFAHEVREGPAEVLTVLRGEKVERFAIQIERADKRRIPSSKSMVIRIVDDRLLRATGGIVQGMSGSPILQGGRLVGAVTHVFVHDPTRGYGIAIEWMLKEATLLSTALASKATSSGVRSGRAA